MSHLSLSEMSSNWWGWRPFMWKLRPGISWECQPFADVGPIPAQIPGTVQSALLRAGIIEDWHVGRQSLDCEWVEHRHWELMVKLSGQDWIGCHKIRLAADGLDYSGWVLVDGREVADFRGALVPHRIDLTRVLSDGQDHILSVLFNQPPPEQGQIGFTSQSRYFKPRYNYSWDWAPRLVPIGTWGVVSFLTDLDAEVELGKVSTLLAEDLKSGSVRAAMIVDAGAAVEGLDVVMRLWDGDLDVAKRRLPLVPGLSEISLEDVPISPWWPNGHGDPKTYRLSVSICDQTGAELWREERKLGFKRIEWLPCEGAPEGALPWICSVNGKPIFLQGVNWSPIRVAYQDTTEPDYWKLVKMYRLMGCTLFRVWGGAYLETETFYDLCDEAGILVWQEFPLSSSGVDNWPPEDEAVIEDLAGIARSYIVRRAHHPSLLMWCGGNELQGAMDGSNTGGGKPTPPDHPCLARLAQVVAEEDPGRRFVHTSSTGPLFYAHASEFGKGLHHDVHGPWGIGSFKDIEEWKVYWRNDDALFRSEVGMPGACDVSLIEKYCGEDALWPPTHPTWVHSSAWWLMWDRYGHLQDLPPEQGLAEYVRQTQALQSEALGFAAERCKARFPKCGGFLIWMGHDCFPCPINNSVLDFEARPKPAYEALKKVYLKSVPSG